MSVCLSVCLPVCLSVCLITVEEASNYDFKFIYSKLIETLTYLVAAEAGEHVGAVAHPGGDGHELGADRHGRPLRQPQSAGPSRRVGGHIRPPGWTEWPAASGVVRHVGLEILVGKDAIVVRSWDARKPFES